MLGCAVVPPSLQQTRVLLAGASGLVGGHCLRRALESPAIAGVVAVARRPLALAHPKLEVALMDDFARLDERPPPRAEAGLCALGTTIKQAGSQAAFRAVDHDAVVAFARWSLRAGCGTFVMVSSVGANPQSRTFYLRVKGEVEESVGALGFERLVVLRPSLIFGERTQGRAGESVAMKMMPVIAPLLAGPLRRYRGISADAIAAAMIAAATDAPTGRTVWEHDQIAAHAG
jgi:uncharacterized protein YbjT (DUF2867 family)